MTVSSSNLNVLITIAAGIVCICPIFFNNVGLKYSTDDAALDIITNPLIYYSPSVIASFFVVIIPAADLLLDLPFAILSYLHLNKKASFRSASVVARLSDIERLLFITGVAVKSTIWFLAVDTDPHTRSLVTNCTENLSILFVLNPVAIFLQRCTVTFTDYTSTVMIICSSVGMSLLTLSNYFQYDRRQYIGITLAGFTLTNMGAVIYVTLIGICAFKYCHEKYGTSKERQLHIKWLLSFFRKEPFTKEMRREQVNIMRSELYTNYVPALHMISSLIIFIATAYLGFSPDQNTVQKIEIKNYVVIIAEVMVLVIELRIRKNEIARGLITLLQSKKSYVRYISHELRTPLNTAFLGLKLLTSELKTSEDPRDVERYDTLCDVNMSCMAAVDILNDLLCYEKLESGILELHKENIVVEPFLKNCISMFSVQAKECGVKITVLTSATVEDNTRHPENTYILSPISPQDSVFADKFKMDQVLRNLISNALKFTPRGGAVFVKAYFRYQPVENALPSAHTNDTLRTELNPDKGSSLNGISSHTADRTGRDTIPAPSRDMISDTVHNPICGQLVVVVTDTGVGISSENQCRLFQEIVQFNPEKLQAGGGSGLGLWITKGIMDLHDGRISVQSEGEGLGTTFTIEMPMSRWPEIDPLDFSAQSPSSNLYSQSVSIKRTRSGSDPSDPGPPGLLFKYESNPSLLRPAAEREKSSSTEHGVPLELLVVDDSRLNRKMLLKCLRAEEHQCYEAGDGLEAIDMVKKRLDLFNRREGKLFDAILMDFVMPNMDGPTATKEIRALGYTGLIFGVTGNGLPSDVTYFLSCGADKVLLKPLDINAFGQAMREMSEIK